MDSRRRPELVTGGREAAQLALETMVLAGVAAILAGRSFPAAPAARAGGGTGRFPSSDLRSGNREPGSVGDAGEGPAVLGLGDDAACLEGTESGEQVGLADA